MPPRERQKLQPRPGDYIQRGPWRPPEGPINQDDYIQRGPWRPPEGAINQDDYIRPMPRYFQPDQSGIMLSLANSPTVNRIQSIYNQVDPFLPEVDWNDQRLGYGYNRDLWGGNLNIGGNYDLDDDQYNLGINWGIGL